MEEIEETSGPSLTLDGGVPCFIMSDGSVKRTTAPQLFNTEGGLLSYAEDYREQLEALYDSVEDKKAAARSAIEEFGLLDNENADEYSIWLLVAMTLED
jgi:hypothetical protein